MNAPRQKLAILLCAASPERPELCPTAFVHAALAAALDCEVEVHFAGPAARLLVEGVAATLFAPGQTQMSILGFMREASALGVRFIGCRMALHGGFAPGEQAIAELTQEGSATDFVLRTLDPEWATLVF